MNTYDIERAINVVGNFLLDWIVPLALWVVAWFATLHFVISPLVDRVWVGAGHFGFVGDVFTNGTFGLLMLLSMLVTLVAIGTLWWQLRLKHRNIW